MEKRYVRLKYGLTGLGNFKEVTYDKNDVDYDAKGGVYESIFSLSKEQVELAKKNGSVAGIKDVVTNKLFWDFDSSDNIELAKKDTLELIKRLKENKFFNNNIQTYFSGKKGFSVVVDTSNELTPEEVRSVCVENFGEGLETLDTKIYDHARMFRVPFSKHQESGLRKIALAHSDLDKMSISDIKSKASNDDQLEQIEYSQFKSDIKHFIKPKEVKKEIILDSSNFDFNSIDNSLKPKFLDLSRWYLQNGFFKEGERNHALLCLASTYKNLGFNKDITYRMLKGVAEIQSKRTKMDRYPDTDIYNNIIMQVYGQTWKGGQYTTKDPSSWLYQYCRKYNIKTKDEVDSKPQVLNELGGEFVKYAKSFFETRIYTGLDDLDNKFPITAGSNIGIIGAASSGKCLGKDTPIRMYDGSIKMSQDIKVGDKLMGDDSLPRTVLSVCSGKERLYEVKQEYGMSYIVNESHILSLKCNYSKYSKKSNGKTYLSNILQKGKIDDISLLDYLKSNKDYKKYFKGYHVGVDYNHKKIEIDPYFLGIWLGDGGTADVRIHNPDPEIKNFMQDYCERLNLTLVNQCKDESRCPQYGLSIKKGSGKNILLEKFRSYGLIGNKHIPKDYLLNDRETRLQVLAGILDTDGYLDKKKNTFELTFKLKSLAEETTELCRSLGFMCNIKEVTKYCIYKGEKKYGTYYRMHISSDKLGSIPNKIARKKAISEEKKTDQTLSSIKITPLDVGDYYGFEIDGNRRFLLKDYTVTHNTAISLNILEQANAQNCNCVFASLDMTKSRLYEKLLYKVTNGDKSRDDIFNDYISGNGSKYDAMIKEKYKKTFIFAKSSPDVEAMRNYIHDVQDLTGEAVRLLMIDYFERISSSISDDTASSKKVAGEIQDLLADFPDLTTVTLVQPNKFSLSGGPDTPILSYTSIKGSSFLYQSFRQILSIWRPFFNPKDSRNDKYMEMAILKNDLGELDMFQYSWHGKTGSIKMMDDLQKNELERLKQEREDEKNRKNDPEDRW